MQTAQTVLRRMRGRAILADEVGLGKTIEAGLVLSELRMWGLADRTLVLTPAGLMEQWPEELEREFGLPTVIARGQRWEETDAERPVVLTSIAAARREPLKSQLTGGSGMWCWRRTRRTGAETANCTRRIPRRARCSGPAPSNGTALSTGVQQDPYHRRMRPGQC
ncbi:hypothetical protein JFN87_03070 [Streptomyces bomunensis]|uniref:SNF2 N-terminal domain-containing protein n=2 Tax=Streptomyces montanisoli TaxID=2798581 RepID=A0A940RTS6_9ACTN|nr:hypothetical protein [Streptomyces montanisoli]